MFQLYRFSPIQDEAELRAAIEHIHAACMKLCFQALGKYLPIAGNVGVFCHYPEEYQVLTEIREKLTQPSHHPDQKYFQLHQAIVIPTKNGLPEARYTHLYIRKPDPYRAQVGDVDFILGAEAYSAIKQSLLIGASIKGARVFERPDLDMIELYDPDIDALGYISTKHITEKVRIKIHPPKKQSVS